MKRAGPSAADVARLAGVSASAVSRSLRPEASASAKMREKVAAAAHALGYHPNAMARAMITRRSGAAAVVMAADTSIYYPEVLKELALAMNRRGIRTMLFMLDQPGDEADAVSQILSYQVDGAVVLTPIRHAHLAALCDRRVPVVLYNRTAEGVPVSAVGCDHRRSGERLAAHLLQLGHRSFALIDGPPGSTVAVERMNGVRAALCEAGLDEGGVWSLPGDYSYGSGRAAAARLVTGHAGGRAWPTALIAANDMMALAALDHIRSATSLKVPRDLSIVGFDGIGAAGWENYELTTMRQPIRRLAAAAADLLAEHIANPDLPVEQRLLSTQLVEGATVSAARDERGAVERRHG